MAGSVEDRRKGEYKTPGGKLVVVELEVEAGVISYVAVSGDFFLEPAEALDRIRAALLGAPVSETQDELAARVQRDLGDDVMMLGFSPEAVAIAVTRALA